MNLPRETLQGLKRDGFTYFKLDFNNLEMKGRKDMHKTRLQIHRDLFRLYREVLGEDVYFSACVGGYCRGAIGQADSLRIGTDSVARWMAPCTGATLVDSLQAVGDLAWTNGRLFAADPDVSYTLPRKSQGRDMNREELRTWNGFVGLLGGTMMISEPIERKPFNEPESLRMLEILCPPAQDKGRSFTPGMDPNHRRFGFVAERAWDRFAAVQMFNPEAAVGSVNLEGVDLSGLGERFHAWSFWDQTYLGVVDRSFVAKDLPSHGSRLLRLTPVQSVNDQRPLLIGSDLHISLGSAELKALIATADELQITLTDAGAREGAIYVYSQRPLTLKSATGCTVKAVEAAGENAWKVRLQGRQRGQGQQIVLRAGAR